jgi:hypothetical protein
VGSRGSPRLRPKKKHGARQSEEEEEEEEEVLPGYVRSAHHGSQLLGDEILLQVESHRTQLVAATQSIEGAASTRMAQQARVAAERAAAEITARLRTEQAQLDDECEAFEAHRRGCVEDLAAARQAQCEELERLRAEAQTRLRAEAEAVRAGLEAERDAERERLRSEWAKITGIKGALKREWAAVDLSAEVAEVYLRRTAEAEASGREAREARAAAETQLRITQELEQKLRTDVAAQTESALHLFTQATQAKRDLELEKAELAGFLQSEESATGRARQLEQELERVRRGAAAAEEQARAGAESRQAEAAAEVGRLRARVQQLEADSARAHGRAVAAVSEMAV